MVLRKVSSALIKLPGGRATMLLTPELNLSEHAETDFIYSFLLFRRALISSSALGDVLLEMACAYERVATFAFYRVCRIHDQKTNLA